MPGAEPGMCGGESYIIRRRNEGDREGGDTLYIVQNARVGEWDGDKG